MMSQKLTKDEMYNRLFTAYTKLFRFVSADHEGLSADEQAHLKNHCQIIFAVASQLQDEELTNTSITMEDFYNSLQVTKSKMKEIDSKGWFEKDDETGTVAEDAVNKYKKAMKNLKNSQDTMTTVFKIIGGNRLSNEYKGKTKEQILAIEENIKSELKQKIEPTDKSVLNFIINLHDEAFQTEREKGKVPHILSSLLRRVNEKEGEVEIITSYPEDNIFVSDEGVKFYHPTEKVKGKPKEITKAQ